MDPINLQYSLKNIPLSGKKQYLKRMLEKVESVIRRMRWKIFFYENPDKRVDKERYGFKSSKAPPKNKRLEAFENDLYEMVRSIRYLNNHRDAFQKQLAEDIEMVRRKEGDQKTMGRRKKGKGQKDEAED